MILFVAGAPHSGTSLIAGTLHRLGVFMGNDWLTPGTYEDAEFASIQTEHDFIELVFERKNKHATWGVKYPPLYKYLWSTSYLFHDAKFIMAYRNAVSVQKKYGEDAILRHYQYAGFWGSFFMVHRFPVLHLDYDESIKNPPAMLDRLMQFANIFVPADVYKTALEFNNGGIGYNET